MEAMEKNLRGILSRWKAVGFSVFALLLLTFILLAATFPAGVVPIAVFASGFGILFGSWAIVKGDWMWARGALLVEGLMLFSSLLIRTASGTVLQTLPLLLLVYIMILFAVEALELVCKLHVTYSKEVQALPFSHSIPILDRTTGHLFQRLSRLGVLFGSCYLLTVGAISLGGLFVSILPVLSDVSLYIVAVSISLALLLILREE